MVTSMDHIHANRLFRIVSYRYFLRHQLSRHCSSIKTARPGRGLGAVAAYIYRFMKERGTIGTDLLVIDNPADEIIVQKFEIAGVKKIACTVKNEKHFVNIKEKLTASTPVYKYDLQAMHRKGTSKVSNAVEMENKFLTSAGDISGVVVLASGVSDIQHLSSHLYLVNRQLVMETFDGFQSQRKLDLFFVLPTSQCLTHHFNSVRFLNSFYEHRHCLTMRYKDVASIFHTDMDKKGRKRLEESNSLSFSRKVSTIQGNDVCLIHFRPKFDVLEQMSLQEREAYQRFIHLMSGNQRLIPALEKVFPGCGLGMIELGYGMADEIFKIPQSHFLQVYKDVKSLPEYEGSVLHHLCSGIEVTNEEVENLNIKLYVHGMWQKRSRKKGHMTR